MAGSPIDGAGKVVDEFDDQLRQAIGRRRLAREEERSRQNFEIWILAEPIVEHYNAQGVEQLPLVFVDAFDLAIEDGVRIDRHVEL